MESYVFQIFGLSGADEWPSTSSFAHWREAQGQSAIGIVLSGADSDGAIGIKRIKEHGGLTIAQEPTEAEHPGMPQAAIATGMVDWVLPVGEMPERLIEFLNNGRRLRLPEETTHQPGVENFPWQPLLGMAQRCKTFFPF